MKTTHTTTECKASVFVYLAPLPDGEPITPVYPWARWQQITECKNERVRKEKYHVWRLLEYAIQEQYRIPLEAVQFTCADGKWSSDVCQFSLSHSHGILCIALSCNPVGVDVEKITEPSDALAKKIFTAEELQRYNDMPKSERKEYFTRIWTHKESLFKKAGGKGFFTTETDGYTEENRVVIQGESYILSVATEPNASIHITHVSL